VVLKLNILNKKEQLFFVLNIFDTIIKTLISIYLAYFLSVGEYAIYLFYLNISAFISIFLIFGSENLLFRKSIKNQDLNINKIFTFVVFNIFIFISALLFLYIFKKFEILILIALTFYQVNFYFYYEYFKLNYLAYLFFIFEKTIYGLILYLLFEQNKLNISNVALSIIFTHIIFIFLTLFYFKDKINFEFFKLNIFIRNGLKDVIFHGSKFFLFGINNILIFNFHQPTDYAGIIIILKLSSMLATFIFFPVIKISRIKIFTLFDQNNINSLIKEIKKMILLVSISSFFFVIGVYVFINYYFLFDFFNLINFLSNKYNFESINFILLFLFVIIVLIDNIIIQLIYMLDEVQKFTSLYVITGTINLILLLLFNDTIAQMLLITFIMSFATYIIAIYKIMKNKKLLNHNI
jgi:hypothetical protein